jgi:two-component system response regulator AtoC
VVDDEDLIRWALRERLEGAGFAVVEAENGRQALEHFSSEVDLVLLDLRLPDLDGLSVLEKIQSSRPGAPVILMTAFGTPETVRKALANGARRVVDKPFDYDGMLRMVTEVLSRRPGPERHAG